MMEQKITIGMPVFNDFDFIEKSIRSVLNQTHQNFKLILSDDGATDGSSEICKQYAAMDSRIHYVRQPINLGISKNMEFLLKQADTEFFMWAGDDDLLHPDFIKTHITNLNADPAAIVSFGSYDVIDEDDVVYNTFDIDYGSSSRLIQMTKLIHFENDGFGYGVFKTNKIRKVRFPIWWWPNRNTPYNNIYPSLMFYLNNGRYLHISDVLFQKRVKTGSNVNHRIGGEGNGFKEIMYYVIRRLYLVHYSVFLAFQSRTPLNVLIIYPYLLLNWFGLASVKMIFKSIKFKLLRK